LVETASGLFIWAVTVCRFIHDGNRFVAKRLNMILIKGGSSAIILEKHLNEIYMTVLKNSISLEYIDEEREEVYYMLRQILGSIVIFFLLLSTYSLSRLLYIPKDDVD
jgi:hypothetical protein